MRSLLAAVSVAVVAVLLLARSVLAEPPPPLEPRPLPVVIEALTSAKGRRGDLAAARFYAEVFGATSINVPVGSSNDTLGAWGDNEALMGAEAALNGCEPLPAEQQKKASALAREFGDALPPLLRAYTLAGEGKQKEAVELFVGAFEDALPSKACPGEHPMYSGRRVRRMSGMLACIKTLAPKRDLKKLQRLLERAESCLANNHAVG